MAAKASGDRLAFSMVFVQGALNPKKKEEHFHTDANFEQGGSKVAAKTFPILVGFVAEIIECDGSTVKTKEDGKEDAIILSINLIPEELCQVGNRIKWTKKGFILV